MISSSYVFDLELEMHNFGPKFGFSSKNPTRNRILRSGFGRLGPKIKKFIFPEFLKNAFSIGRGGRGEGDEREENRGGELPSSAPIPTPRPSHPLPLPSPPLTYSFQPSPLPLPAPCLPHLPPLSPHSPFPPLPPLLFSPSFFLFRFFCTPFCKGAANSLKNKRKTKET